jgi:hypothetical protein
MGTVSQHISLVAIDRYHIHVTRNYDHVHVELMFALYLRRSMYLNTPFKCLLVVRVSSILPRKHHQFPHFQRILESEARNPLAHFPIKNITVINADVR